MNGDADAAIPGALEGCDGAEEFDVAEETVLSDAEFVDAGFVEAVELEDGTLVPAEVSLPVATNVCGV